jgi:hypothetical protein
VQSALASKKQIETGSDPMKKITNVILAYEKAHLKND